jgi:hypothetical protein
MLMWRAGVYRKIPLLFSFIILRMLLRLITVLLFLFYNSSAWSQIRKTTHRRNTHLHAIRTNKLPFGKKKYSTIGITLNALNYYGDIAPLPKKMSSDINFTRPGVGIAYTLRKGPRYTLQSQFLYGIIRGDDAASAAKDDDNGIYRIRRNTSFRNAIKELSVSAVFDLFDNNSVYTHRPQWTPYVFFGASIFHHNPKARVPDKDLNGHTLSKAGQWVALQPLGTEGQFATLDKTDVNYGIKPYPLIQPSLLFGLGVRYKINEVLDCWFDFSMRYTFTDYLDDVSRNYVDLGVFTDPLSQSLSYRTYQASVPVGSTHTYLARDGKYYTVEAGYGSEYRDNWRGNKNDRDIILVTSLRLSHVIGQSFHRAKTR